MSDELTSLMQTALRQFPYATIEIVDGEITIFTGLEQKDTGQILPIEPDERGEGW